MRFFCIMIKIIFQSVIDPKKLDLYFTRPFWSLLYFKHASQCQYPINLILKIILLSIWIAQNLKSAFLIKSWPLNQNRCSLFLTLFTHHLHKAMSKRALSRYLRNYVFNSFGRYGSSILSYFLMDHCTKGQQTSLFTQGMFSTTSLEKTPRREIFIYILVISNFDGLNNMK